MKPKVTPPAGARYRCGFPGCAKRYVSTDGVRKHARKMHADWLRQVDVMGWILCTLGCGALQLSR